MILPKRIKPVERKSKACEVLCTLLDYHGLTAYDLSKKINIAYSTIYFVANKPQYSPKVATLIPIAKYFGITVDQLIGNAPLDNITNPKAELSEKYKESIDNERLETQVCNAELYLECIGVLNEYIKDYGDGGLIISFPVFNNIVCEIYKYSYSKGLPHPHLKFADWLIKKTLEVL